ncbi:MAG TPA: hypothetical protein ENK55_03560 [Actinobacteria bacterium]|nr:hypothetical protein [Actinomycetota bacterium]
MIGTARHLVERFVGFLLARPPSPSEQRWVAEHLDPAAAALFFAQRAEDQRHAIEVARLVADDPALVEAALLHDVGKADAALGPVARALATVLDALGVPLRGRWARYRAHGTLGAGRLAEVGASPLAVAFAAGHPGPCPDHVDPVAWARLAAADDGEIVGPETAAR